MITTAVFDTKPYDREPLQQAAKDRSLAWRFLEYRLSVETAPRRSRPPGLPGRRDR